MDAEHVDEEEEEPSGLSDLAMVSNSSLFGSDTFSASSFLNCFPSSVTCDFLNQLQASMVAASSCSGSSSACTSTASPLLSNPPTQILARNSTKTLKCPKCNWHYKYQETLEIHMKEKHAEGEVNCAYCAQNQPHPKLARGESYSCGYKPYRCDLCKYSTTTKGNLSIHMQSDKHLHAMQEMPINLNNMASSPSHAHPSLLMQSCSDSGGLEGDGRALLQCLICGNFASAELAAMLEHLELDRSRTCAGDIQAAHGFFQCNLCPYNTNLKANFQLHTRTDKHLQRVQLINHMREGMNAMVGNSTSALCRLAAIKSMVQVRCRACQDVFSCAFSLREHCESVAHLSQLNFLQHQLSVQAKSTDKQPFCLNQEDNSSLTTDSESQHLLAADTSLHHFNLLWLQMICQQTAIDPINNLVYQCLCCTFHTSHVNLAKAHLSQHLEPHQLNFTLQEEDNHAPSEDSKPACNGQPLHLIFSWDDLKNYLLEMDEARFSCNQCPDFCAESQELLEEHECTHQQDDEKPSSSSLSQVTKGLNEVLQKQLQIKCPLCSHKLADNKTAVRYHLSQEHKIVEESAVEKLTSGVESSSEPTCLEAKLKVESSECPEVWPASAIFRYRCTDCSMAFTTDERLQQHQLSHSNPQTFRLNQRCPFSAATGSSTQSNCDQKFENASSLYQHVFECHRPENGELADQPSSATPRGCELCGCDNFASAESLISHLKSPAHLNRTKQLLEEKQQMYSSASSSFSPLESGEPSNGRVEDFKHNSAQAEHFNEQMFSLLLRQNPSLLPTAPQFGNCSRPSSKRNGTHKSSSSTTSSSQLFSNQRPSFATNAKPFRCNVCIQAYSQGQTLDTHLRSLSHQNRMNRLQELVGNGQVDALRPVSEQPGGIPQKIIAELLGLPFSPEKGDVSPILSSLFFGNSMANEQDETNGGVDLSLKKRKTNPCLPKFMKPLSTEQPQQAHKHNTNTGSFLNNFSSVNKSSKCSQPSPLLAGQMMAMAQLLQQQQHSDTANSPTNWLAAMMAIQQQQTPVAPTMPMFDFSALLNSQLGLGTPSNQEEQDEEDNEDSPSTSPPSSSPVLAQGPRIKVTPAKSRHHNKKTEKDGEEKSNSAPPPDKPFSLSDLLSKRESREEKKIKEEDREESPQVKRLRSDSTPSANNIINPIIPFGEAPKTPVKGVKKVESPINDAVGNQLAMMMSATSGFPSFLAAAMAAQNGGGMGAGTDLLGSSMGCMSSGEGDSPQKRARTRITDDQLKVLRQYFDINNSPSEEQIKEMSLKAGLPEKVIKHWFRNTLFKERQRDKDSPYNFNVPPQMSIDLATYEKTGETKVTPLKQQTEPVDPDHQPASSGSSPSAEVSTTNATSPQQPLHSFAVKCSPACSPISKNGGETPNEVEDDDEQEDGEEDNQPSSPTNENSSSNSTAFAADFLVNLNKAAAVAAANNLMANYITPPGGHISNYAAVAASMAAQQQQQQGFASFFGVAASNPLAIQQETSMEKSEEKTLSAMLGLGSFPNFSPSSIASSSNNATPSLAQQPQSSLVHSSSQSSPALVGTGRRANRTRFTDFQLRTLQNFFDKQAYPKDDDLEMLSKKMGLSPRVIVVWFQNARQKARKIYENQPNHPDNNDRFVRTPGANFQCKRCQLVFQRYYELIQHQQKVCYIGDGDAQQTDNKSLEENLSEDEKGISSGISQANILNGLNLGLQENNSSSEQQNHHHQAALMASSLMSSMLTPETMEKFNISLNNNNNNSEIAAHEGQQSNAQQELFKLITSSGKSSAEAMLKMFKNKERKHQFYKRCPFCGVLFQSKEKLVEHLPKKHAEQMQAANVDVDALPDAEDVPSFSDDFLNRLNNGNSGDGLLGRGTSPLDLSFPIANEEEEQHHQQSASPTSQSEENDDENRVDTYDDYSGISAFDQLSRNSPIGSSRSSVTPSSNFATALTNTTSNSHQGSVAAAAAAAAIANSKRYRTHLTPLQVYIMKSLFNDYKTPSMSECDLLGREIGLHKRVVQVWYQNARAKERKSKGEEETQSTINARVPLPRCELCCVEFSLLTTSMQDHIFTPSHIEKIKERGASFKAVASNPAVGNQEQPEQQQQQQPEVQSKSSRAHTHSSSNSQSSRQKAVRDKRHSSSSQHSSTEALAQFPYNLMGYGMPHAAAALPSMIYDPNLIGTPISMLQIPELVMQQISSDLAKGKQASRFTQDGLKLGQLNGKVSESDFLCASTMESEVGWACPQCSNVFQQESFLRNHQKLICQGCDGVFRLIQIHYECVPCHAKFGTQDEFRLHCDTASHKSLSNIYSVSSSSSNSQTKSMRGSSTTSC